MNQNYTRGFAMVLFVLFFTLTGGATGENTNYLFDQETIITGVVEQEGDAFILQAIDGDQYSVTGQDLSELVGKKVKACGELVIDQNENWLNVNEIIEVWEGALDPDAISTEEYSP